MRQAGSVDATLNPPPRGDCPRFLVSQPVAGHPKPPYGFSNDAVLWYADLLRVHIPHRGLEPHKLIPIEKNVWTIPAFFPSPPRCSIWALIKPRAPRSPYGSCLGFSFRSCPTRLKCVRIGFRGLSRSRAASRTATPEGSKPFAGGRPYHERWMLDRSKTGWTIGAEPFNTFDLTIESAVRIGNKASVPPSLRAGTVPGCP